MKHHEVRAEVARLEADIANELGATAAFVVQGLIDNATDGDNTAARNRALELLGKMQGLFTERSEITHHGVVYTLDIDTELIVDP